MVVDDDPVLARTVGLLLRRTGYDVVLAHDGTTGLQAAATTHPDVVLLDLDLPDLDGLEVLAGLRPWFPGAVLVLTGTVDDAGTVAALDGGADDVVGKPVSSEVLLARVRAATRRTRAGAVFDPVVVTPDFTVDLASCHVHAAGRRVHLTPIEWSLLAELTRASGRLVSQAQLLDAVWGQAGAGHGNYLRVHLSALRHKLEPEPAAPRYLHTEPGMGYRFTPAGETMPAP